VSISGLRFADAKSNNDGAAIYNYDSDLTLTNMAFTGNASTTGADDGGAISDIFGNLTIRFTTLSGNAAADEGGAIDVYSPHGGGPGQVLIDHSTITGNASTVGGAGGGIFQYADSLVITNSTIAGNHADAVAGQGGGIDVIYTDPQLTNTIVADNTAPAFPDIYGYSNQGNFTGTLSLVENLGGETLGGTGNLTGVDPKLGPLADNGGPTQTLALQAGSPAIDKGVDSGTDQRGAPRPFDQQGASNAPGGNAADIGAYERVLCANVPVNKIGTGGKDNLIGTAGIDGILGLGGKDTLKGLAGNDALCGGPGKDKLKGGAGADKLRGEGGADTLIGGKGKDVLKGGPGKDKQTQ
jgi:hypothetical protein